MFEKHQPAVAAVAAVAAAAAAVAAAAATAAADAAAAAAAAAAMTGLQSYWVAHPWLPSATCETLEQTCRRSHATHLLQAHCLLRHAHRHATRHSESGGRNSIRGNGHPLMQQVKRAGAIAKTVASAHLIAGIKRRH